MVEFHCFVVKCETFSWMSTLYVCKRNLNEGIWTFSGFWSTHYFKASWCSCCYGLPHSCTFVRVLLLGLHAASTHLAPKWLLPNASNFFDVYTSLLVMVLHLLLPFKCFASQSLIIDWLMQCVSCFCRYIPKYTFSWLVKPMWLVISKFFISFPVLVKFVPRVKYQRANFWRVLLWF